MSPLAWLAVPILLSRMATGSDDGSFEVNIVLLSNLSTASGLGVSGKVVDIPSDDTSVILYATLLINISGFAQVPLNWHKNGRPVNVYRSDLRGHVCEGHSSEAPILNCTLGLPLSEVSDGVAGNYTLKYHSYDNDPVIITWVTVFTGRAQRLEFTSFPNPVVSCSSVNATASLSYSASGFPRPSYSLNCSDELYYHSPTQSTGVFVLPPDLCYSNVTCQAVARNDYQSLILSPVTMIVAVSRPSFRLWLPAADSLGRQFQVHPVDMINADLLVTSGMVVLQYSAAGAATYSLYCNTSTRAGTSTANFSSASGNFTILPLLCGVNTSCHAVASFIGADSIISPETMLLTPACRPAVMSAIPERLPNIPLIVSLVLSITVASALVAIVVSCCRRRRNCVLYQSKVCIEARQATVSRAAVEPPIVEYYPIKTDEVCSDCSKTAVYPNGISKATHEEQLQGQAPTYSHPIGMQHLSQYLLTNLRRDGSRPLETDCGGSSAIEPQQPSGSGFQFASEHGLSAEPVSLPSEHYSSPTSSSTVIVISASHVQLGNGNTMICNCIGELDHVTISLPDCPSEP